MKFSQYLQNEHFNNLTAIIRVPSLSSRWRRQYSQVPFFSLRSAFSDLVFADFEIASADILSAFTNLLLAIVSVDEKLSYTQDDFAWFVSILDNDASAAVLGLLCAYMVAPCDHLTPLEVAEQTGTSQSNWRNKAAAGDIPGAVKKGKQWLLPVPVLKAHGIL